MPEIKFVINDVKTGRSYQKVLTDESLLGKKIGDNVSGAFLGLPGYELKVTGGSDTAGFPMRPDIEGGARKKLLVKKGDIGTRLKDKGVIIRKTIRGNAISNFTAQVNLKVEKYGTKGITELFGIKEEVKEGKKETSKEEKSKTKKKEEKKIEKK